MFIFVCVNRSVFAACETEDFGEMEEDIEQVKALNDVTY